MRDFRRVAVKTIIWMDVIGLTILIGHFDQAIVDFMNQIRNLFLRHLMDVAKYMGRGVTQFLAGMFLVGLGAYIGYRPLGRLGWCWAKAVAVAGIGVLILKHYISRPRPRMNLAWLDTFGPSLTSGIDAFPSGHSATTFAVAVVLARAVPRMKGFIYFFATFIGLFRVVGASHYPTDIIAGAMFGIIVGHYFSKQLLPTPEMEWSRKRS